MNESANGPAVEPAGTVIGGYVVERLLGAGGMGAVYAAGGPPRPPRGGRTGGPPPHAHPPTTPARGGRRAWTP